MATGDKMTLEEYRKKRTDPTRHSLSFKLNYLPAPKKCPVGCACHPTNAKLVLADDIVLYPDPSHIFRVIPILLNIHSHIIPTVRSCAYFYFHFTR